MTASWSIVTVVGLPAPSIWIPKDSELADVPSASAWLAMVEVPER